MAQLLQEIPDENVFDGALDEALENDQGSQKEDENEEPKPKITKPRKPLPRLDEARLCRPEGLPALATMFKDFRADPSKPALDSLDDFMNEVEHWAHRVYPNANFDDFLGRCEVLGHKRTVQTTMTKLRTDMPLVDEDFVDKEPESIVDDDDEPENMANEHMTCSQVINDDHISMDSNEPTINNDNSCTTDIPESLADKPATQLTEDQLQRMRDNRLKAMERRREKQVLATQQS